jgi:hypothetical protein
MTSGKNPVLFTVGTNTYGLMPGTVNTTKAFSGSTSVTVTSVPTPTLNTNAYGVQLAAQVIWTGQYFWLATPWNYGYTTGYYSSNGTSWTAVTINAAGYTRASATNGSGSILCSNNGNSLAIAYFSSANPPSFSNVGLGSSAQWWPSYANGYWFLTTTGLTNNIGYSSNGTTWTWTSATSSAYNILSQIQAVNYINGMWVAITSTGQVIYATGSTPSTWNVLAHQSVFVNNQNNASGPVYPNYAVGNNVAVGTYNGSSASEFSIGYSYDFVNWTPVSLNIGPTFMAALSGNDSYYNSWVCFTNGIFFAALTGTNSNTYVPQFVWWSVDGINWQQVAWSQLPGYLPTTIATNGTGTFVATTETSSDSYSSNVMTGTSANMGLPAQFGLYAGPTTTH